MLWSRHRVCAPLPQRVDQVHDRHQQEEQGRSARHHRRRLHRVRGRPPAGRPRTVAGLPDGFRFYDLRHTGHTLSTRSGATLRDTMVRAGQSAEKAALICQHSDENRQRAVAAGLDGLVRAERAKHHNDDRAHQKAEPPESQWCGCGARTGYRSRQQRTPGPLAWGFLLERVTRIELALSAWEADVLPLNYTRVRRRPKSGSGAHCTPSLAPGARTVGAGVRSKRRATLRGNGVGAYGGGVREGSLGAGVPPGSTSL